MTYSIDALQWPLTVVMDIGFADVAAGPTNVAFIPDGAIILGVSTHVDVAFDNDVEIKLPGGTVAATIKLAAQGAAVGFPARVASGGMMTAARKTAAPTTGHAYVTVQYVVPGRANETSHG